MTVLSTEVYFYSSHINADGDEYDGMKWTNTNMLKKESKVVRKK